jgi:RHS repeat-associated protein
VHQGGLAGRGRERLGARRAQRLLDRRHLHALLGSDVPEPRVPKRRRGDGLGFHLRFQGQYRDQETGLHYNHFRTYDPELGIFIEPDPLGPEGGLNAYAYVRNPIGWVDPLGLENGAALNAAMGGNCPPGFQSHHLIPEELYNTHGYKGLLGGNPHTAGNGIYLRDSQESYDAHKASGTPPQPPGRTIHNGKHSSAYKNYVTAELNRIKGLPPCQRPAALDALKSDLRTKMQNGTFEGESTSGKTVQGLNKNGNVQ